MGASSAQALSSVFAASDRQEKKVGEVFACVHAVCLPDWLKTGPWIARFTTLVRRLSTTAAATSNGRRWCIAALHATMAGAGLPRGVEVITTPLTFCATHNSVIRAGLKAALADAARMRTYRSRRHCISGSLATWANHSYAFVCRRPCDTGRIMTIEGRHDLVIIAEWTHAIEATFRGRPAGSSESERPLLRYKHHEPTVESCRRVTSSA
ncbi:DegT/DnrJ/EryC1/StrS family aminotransferase [Lysobacter sp. HA18]